MASKRTTSTKKVAPKAKIKKSTTTKKGPKEKQASKGPRHPKGRVTELHGGKEALAKALAASLATDNDDSDVVAGRLKTASNKQLLRLQQLVETVKKRWGSREKLVESITKAGNSAKDKDYVAKLGTFSLPRLVDMASAVERRARA